MDNSSIELAYSSCYDFSQPSRSFQHNRFYCNLPALLCVPTRPTPSQPITAPKKSDKDQEDTDRFIRDENTREDWIIPVTEKLADTFAKSALKDLPIFNVSVSIIGVQRDAVSSHAEIRRVTRNGLQRRNQLMKNGRKKHRKM